MACFHTGAARTAHSSTKHTTRRRRRSIACSFFCSRRHGHSYRRGMRSYRDAYTIEKLREVADCGKRAESSWPAFQAIWRLAHQGCDAGDLKVTAFNGRLFAPRGAPRLGTASVSPESVRRATLALSTASVRTRSSRERIAYGDLGV